MAFTGAVLTGGRSTRLGTDKAFVEVGGVAMVSIVADALVEAGASEVVAIGGDATRLDALGLVTRPDSWPGEGPLGGIIDALDAANEPIVVVMACDQPAIRAELVRRLVAAIDTNDAVVPVVDGREQPLTAAYAAHAVDALRTAFHAGERAPRRALRRLRWRAIHDVDPTWVDDVDDHADLARYAAASPSSRRDRRGTIVPTTGGDRRVDVNEIDVDTLERYLAAGAPLVDVRQPDEYEHAHVPGARLLPLDELPELVDEIPMEVPVYLICQTGARSHRAAEWLLAQGYDATNVAGGTVAWVEAGKATASGTDPG